MNSRPLPWTDELNVAKTLDRVPQSESIGKMLRNSRVHGHYWKCSGRHLQNNPKRTPSSPTQCIEEVRVLAIIGYHMLSTGSNDLVF